VGNVHSSELEALDLLIVGSPTHGGRPTPATLDFLHKIPGSALEGTRVAAFDTRLTVKVLKIFGYAAGGIARRLKRKGGTLVAAPEAFVVTGTEGPLQEGELERAAGWARKIAQQQGENS
jgi:flavodoxin